MKSSYTIQQIEALSKPFDTSLVDTTNVLATTNYPSDSGFEMGIYTSFSLTGKLITATGTNSISVEVTNDETVTGADWVTVYGYDAKNETFVNSIAAAAGTTTFAWDFDAINYKRVRVKLTIGDAVNTSIIKMRRRTL